MADIEHNEAAWFNGAQAQLVVGPGPDQTNPAADEVIVKIAAIAINPVDWKFQDWSPDFLKYPHVLGSDAAGTVVKVGSNVTRFKAGDRVMGHGLGLSYGGSRHGTFQKYAAFRERTTSAIPDTLSFEQVSVLPLGISTAASGLYEILGLRLPSVPAHEPTKEVVLIWGGASSMGTVAIQLVSAAGYSVITTASAKNHAYIKSLVPNSNISLFDYNDADVVEKVKAAIKTAGKFAGVYDAVSSETTMRTCADITHTFGGGPLATTLPPPAGLPEDVKVTSTYGTKPGIEDDHPGRTLWDKFVPEGLNAGTFLAKPDPKVVGHGLESLQAALNAQKAGVSAQKVVVTL